MELREWTEEAIRDTVADPAETRPVWDYTTGSQQPATAYVPTTPVERSSR
jgi:hypothetical protein